MIKCALLNVERGRLSLARFPERSKGTDLRSVALASWVRIPHRAVMGHNSVRLLVVCPGYKKQNELFPFSTARC